MRANAAGVRGTGPGARGAGRGAPIRAAHFSELRAAVLRELQ